MINRNISSTRLHWGFVLIDRTFSLIGKNLRLQRLIWRSDVLFTNLHSGHLGISMMDSNTTEYIEKKNIFKLSSHWQFRNISSSFGFVLYSSRSCGSFFIWKFEAELHNKVMIYSKERAFDAFWKLILKYLPFIDHFLPHLLWKFWTRIRLFWKLT